MPLTAVEATDENELTLGGSRLQGDDEDTTAAGYGFGDSSTDANTDANTDAPAPVAVCTTVALNDDDEQAKTHIKGFSCQARIVTLARRLQFSTP